MIKIYIKNKIFHNTYTMINNENPKEKKDRLKSLSSKERKLLIRKKLKMQGLKEGSGVREKDQSSYDKKEIIDLILLTKCFPKEKF